MCGCCSFQLCLDLLYVFVDIEVIFSNFEIMAKILFVSYVKDITFEAELPHIKKSLQILSVAQGVAQLGMHQIMPAEIPKPEAIYLQNVYLVSNVKAGFEPLKMEISPTEINGPQTSVRKVKSGR